MKRRVVAALCTAMFLASCSQDGAAGQYSQFCALAKEMDQTSSGPHGEDPAAITDPARMRETWESITSLADRMKAESPEEVASDLGMMLTTLQAMDEIFAANDYDLTAMATNPETRASLDALSQDADVEAASVRFNAFMEKNCPKS